MSSQLHMTCYGAKFVLSSGQEYGISFRKKTGKRQLNYSTRLQTMLSNQSFSRLPMLLPRERWQGTWAAQQK